MTGPALGKIPLDAKVYLIGGFSRVPLVNTQVYIHLKGYARAKVTHCDIEHEFLNEIIAPNTSRFLKLRSDGNRLVIIELNGVYDFNIGGENCRVGAIVIECSQLARALGRISSKVYVGGKFGGIFLGLRKEYIEKIEKLANAIIRSKEEKNSNKHKNEKKRESYFPLKNDPPKNIWGRGLSIGLRSLKIPVWTKNLLLGDGHTLIVGRTGSGKSNTLRFLAKCALGTGWRVLVLDWSGEHRIHGLPNYYPLIPYDLVRELLPTVLEETLRPTSGGIAIGYSVMEAVSEAENWSELIAALKAMEARRDLGATAALRRLIPLRRAGVLVDENIKSEYLKYAVINLSYLPPFEKRITLSMMLAMVYALAIDGKMNNTCIFVEEAWQLHMAPDQLPITLTMLMELRKYGIKVFAIYQYLFQILMQHNLIIHNLGPRAKRDVYSLGLPVDVLDLRIGEAMLYSVMDNKWKKIKIPKVD